MAKQIDLQKRKARRIVIAIETTENDKTFFNIVMILRELRRREIITDKEYSKVVRYYSNLLKPNLVLL